MRAQQASATVSGTTIPSRLEETLRGCHQPSQLAVGKIPEKWSNSDWSAQAQPASGGFQTSEPRTPLLQLV